MTIDALERQSIHDVVYWKLRSALQDGLFPPGRKLTNRHLAGTIGFSITPVREAIRRLVSEGALHELPSGSVAVPDLDLEAFLDDLSWLLRVLGERALANAIPRLTPADVVKLETAAKQARAACQAGDALEANAQHRHFYFLLFARSGQPTLMAHLDMLWLKASGLHNHIHPAFSRAEDGRHYAEMLSAAQARDPAAALAAFGAYHDRLEAHVRKLAGRDAAGVAVPDAGSS